MSLNSRFKASKIIGQRKAPCRKRIPEERNCCYQDVYVNSFFPSTARLWNSLPIECFPLTFDLKHLQLQVLCKKIFHML